MKSHRPQSARFEKVHEICKIILKVAIINFAVYFVIVLIIGGDAINGHETVGHYYLAGHGKVTEVSYFTFVYSKIHSNSLLVTHPLGMIAVIVYYLTGGKREDLWKSKSTKKARKQLL